MKTVLVVEDEPSIVSVIKAVLEDEGYRIVTAGNGQEGLARLAERPTDLVILDVMMPVMDGREMYRVMQSHPAYANIPVVVMSAAPPFNLPDGRRYAAFMPKPFDLDTLIVLVRRFIGDPDPAARMCP